ncbi:hypothetical protein M427DRAFT_147827 [Gonapodya prolifera JEL478]|uniref:BHLH domain-containing protein n=1 Tax=Gonapodya prolifera (strain JEL478) TaxID=1344416 RepID=A0A139A3X5_GONPJ|nr:hypothetical protein M427DRAFT_147827 [Gonapodya prolifera JEL478]|eukprot:KXS11490.1 hypothetical protein M427DRAFT_147827 [Gonapodya prolifera JEL478]
MYPDLSAHDDAEFNLALTAFTNDGSGADFADTLAHLDSLQPSDSLERQIEYFMQIDGGANQGHVSGGLVGHPGAFGNFQSTVNSSTMKTGTQEDDAQSQDSAYGSSPTSTGSRMDVTVSDELSALLMPMPNQAFGGMVAPDDPVAHMYAQLIASGQISLDQGDAGADGVVNMAALNQLLSAQLTGNYIPQSSVAQSNQYFTNTFPQNGDFLGLNNGTGTQGNDFLDPSTFHTLLGTPAIPQVPSPTDTSRSSLSPSLPPTTTGLSSGPQNGSKLSLPSDIRRQPAVIVMPRSSDPRERAENIARVRKQMEEQKKRDKAAAGAAQRPVAKASKPAVAASRASSAQSNAAAVPPTRARTPGVEVVVVTDDDDRVLSRNQSAEMHSQSKSGTATPQPTFTLPPSSLVIGPTPTLPASGAPPGAPIVFRVAGADSNRKPRAPKGRGKREDTKDILMQDVGGAAETGPKDVKGGRAREGRGGKGKPVNGSISEAVANLSINTYTRGSMDRFTEGLAAAQGNRSLLPTLTMLLRQANGGLPSMPMPSPSPRLGDEGVAVHDVEGARMMQMPTPTSSPPGSASTPDAGTSTASDALPHQPHPKTSHNQIEKRYRDNLNERIRELAETIPNIYQPGMAGGRRGSSELSDPESPVLPSATLLGNGFDAKRPHKATVLRNAVHYIGRLREENSGLKRENDRLRIRCAELEEALLSVALGRQPTVMGGNGGFVGAGRSTLSPERDSDISAEDEDLNRDAARKRKRISAGSNSEVKQESQHSPTEASKPRGKGSTSLPYTATLFSFAALMQLGDFSYFFGNEVPVGPHGDTKVFATNSSGSPSSTLPVQSWGSFAWDSLRLLLAIICILHIIVSVILVPPESRAERMRKRRERASSSSEARALKAMESMQDFQGPSAWSIYSTFVGDVISLTLERLFGIRYITQVVRHVSKRSEGRKSKLGGSKPKNKDVAGPFEVAIALPSGSTFTAAGAYLRSLRARLPTFEVTATSNEELRVHLTAALHLRLMSIAQSSSRARALADRTWNLAVDASTAAEENTVSATDFVSWKRPEPMLGVASWLGADPEMSKQFWERGDVDWLPELLADLTAIMLKGTAEERERAPTILVADVLGKTFRRWILLSIIKDSGCTVSSVLTAPLEDQEGNSDHLELKTKTGAVRSQSLEQHLHNLLTPDGNKDDAGVTWSDLAVECSDDLIALAQNVADNALDNGDLVGAWYGSALGAFAAWRRVYCKPAEVQSALLQEGDQMAWTSIRLAKKLTGNRNADGEAVLARRFINIALMAVLAKAQSRPDMAERAIVGAQEAAERLRKQRFREQDASTAELKLGRILEFVGATWLFYVATWCRLQILKEHNDARPPIELEDVGSEARQNLTAGNESEAGLFNASTRSWASSSTDQFDGIATASLRSRYDSAIWTSFLEDPRSSDLTMRILAVSGHLRHMLPFIGGIDNDLANGFAEVAKQVDHNVPSL